MSLAFGTNHVTANAENRTLHPGKTAAEATNPFKRPALGDVGNRLDRFAAPGLRNGAKKLQAVKGATFAKNDPKLTKVLKSGVYHQLKSTDSTSSLFSSSNLKQEIHNKKEAESFSTGLLEEIEEVDKNDKDNQFLLAIYTCDIYTYLLELEQMFPVKMNFLENQDITPKMRATLVDWLVDVQEQYKLLQETLFLTISIIDRYLQGVPTERTHLQLVGVAALFIAGKYEEIYFVDVGELIFVTDNAYSKADLLRMESKILKQLDFSLGKPLSLHFLRRFSKVAGVLPIHHNFSKYFLECSLMDYELCHIRPSRLAAAALYIAKSIHGDKVENAAPIWNRTLEHYSGVPRAEVQEVATKMAAMVLKSRNSKYQAIDRKYSSSKLMKVCQRPELSSDSFKLLAVGSSV